MKGLSNVVLCFLSNAISDLDLVGFSPGSSRSIVNEHRRLHRTITTTFRYHQQRTPPPAIIPDMHRGKDVDSIGTDGQWSRWLMVVDIGGGGRVRICSISHSSSSSSLILR
uniref:Uncharacterized protein n=1 Tax=Lactuca sativa TaxID=4236 RepID=A0A9R1VJE4_LACSA|nr:hypothetical protein LSAT_V11C500260950 [Lactuca sativa]